MPSEFDEPVLLVEDTKSLATIYREVLKQAGLQVQSAGTIADARKLFDSAKFRVILLDVMLPDGDGIDFLRHAREASPDAKVIVITANGSINRAVEAMKEGAFDFLVKPFDHRKMMTSVEAAIRALKIEDFASPDVEQTPRWRNLTNFIGSSEPMQNIYRMVESIGRSSSTVFVTGESGTGKEVCAEMIHSISARCHGPFVPLNCGAIPSTLLESEVFGHLKGSFTGAIADKVGAAAAADGGTLFLDEICEMDLALQTKLLRFLQTSTVQPVGATRPQKVDVRIICATNRDPAQEVRAGRFREDLFYRLHVVPITLPPLRERGEDVIEIANYLLEVFAAEERKSFRALSLAAKAKLRTHRWPGNVRELQNVLRNAVVLHDGTVVESDMIRLGAAEAPERLPEASPAPEQGAGREQVEQALAALVGTPLEVLERAFISKTIEQCDGSIPRAARLLEVSPSTLYRKRESWLKSDTEEA